MENLIDYLIYALMGYNVHFAGLTSGIDGRRSWVLDFGDHKDVALVFDEVDIAVIKNIAANRELDDEERERYEKLFELCQ